MSRDLGEVTVATKASSKFASLRTTIPMSIVKQWKLKDGDKIDWEWKVLDGKMALIVTRVTKSKD
jgi:hypothetical protein